MFPLVYGCYMLAIHTKTAAVGNAAAAVLYLLNFEPRFAGQAVYCVAKAFSHWITHSWQALPSCVLFRL